ncbi:MAG: hypothetical protein IT385_20365 [Deltaproteobacteria bacterium]|nr:hypothetical protein [Deltaproteobacteria bacterium]
MFAPAARSVTLWLYDERSGSTLMKVASFEPGGDGFGFGSLEAERLLRIDRTRSGVSASAVWAVGLAELTSR